MGDGGGGDKKWGGDTGGAEKYGDEIAKGDDFNLMTVIGRRLGDEVDPGIMRLINDPRGNQILVFPSEGAVSLAEGMKEVERRRSEGRGCRGREESGSVGAGEQGAMGDKSEKEGDADAAVAEDDDNDRKVTLIFLDATWKYASEMYKKNKELVLWPSDIIIAKLVLDREGCVGAYDKTERNRDGESLQVEGINSKRREVGRRRSSRSSSLG